MTDGRWTADDPPDLSGATAVVTGANSGIGLETTRELARAGAHVVLACRDRGRGDDARADVAADDPAGSLAVRELDLASLDAVERFAGRVAADHDALDLLVNNGGVMGLPRRETDDGFERQFGVNHLGHFALTGRLLDRLLAADDGARVVTVSSGMHRQGRIDFDDLHHERSYDRWGAYAASKLANLLFAFELQRRAAAADADLVSVGVHPGYASTNLQGRAAEAGGSLPERLVMPVLDRLLAQSAAKGALPTLYAATHPDVEGGEYVGPGGLWNMRGVPEVQEPTARARDPRTAARLWERSEELTDVAYDLPDPRSGE